jgi:pimeloyl-ACP methyl ester carboxylesterase
MDFLNEIEDKFIKTNNIKLHTILIGSGEPLILLHGFPDFWYGWKNIIPGLKDDFKLIIPDLRGYNLSDKPKGVDSYRVEILVEDIKGLIDSLELKFNNIYLAGHDWGGVIAWCFAERYPTLLKKLIILNAPHPKIFQEKLRNSKAQQEASFYIFEFLKPNGEKFAINDDFKWLKWAVFRGVIDKKNFTEFDKKQYLEAWSQPDAILGGVNYYRANVNFDNWTGIIEIPTLVIHGMKDVAVLPHVLEDLDHYVKSLKIIKSKNSSHWVMHDDPNLVITQIKNFIEK